MEAYNQEFEADDDKVPCPSPWFAQTMEEIAMIEQTGCSLHELLFKLPIEVRNRHMAYKTVMDKARPELERQAREQAKAEQHESMG